MRVRFDYSRIRVRDGSIVNRPHIDVVLRRPPGFTPTVSVVIDTGSDFCIFDFELARSIGFDPSTVGKKTSLEGIGAAVDAWIVPVSVYVVKLKRAFEIDGYFCVLRRGIFGVLGHRGFLEHFETRFARAEYFEITDERPAEVVNLRLVQ